MRGAGLQKTHSGWAKSASEARHAPIGQLCQADMQRLPWHGCCILLDRLAQCRQ
jgi:hypothetical protein